MQVYSQRTRQSMSLINGSIQNGEWVRLPKHSVKAGKRKKILSNHPFFTPYLHTIKRSFFPSFPANHENNPAANKAGNA